VTGEEGKGNKFPSLTAGIRAHTGRLLAYALPSGTGNPAQAALIDTFSLRRRSLGQPAYIAEVAAALEDVEGVITATVKTFAIPDDSAVLRVALTGSAKSAYFPHPNQVISVDPASAGADMAVKVEAV